MTNRRPSGELPTGPLVVALVMTGCCALVALALWAPVARAQLILSGLPAIMAMAAVWLNPKRRK
jgi:hypothetical protein